MEERKLSEKKSKRGRKNYTPREEISMKVS